MLRRIHVDNFRGLVNFTFEPERVNLLVGANGSGKSTFLNALVAIHQLANGLPIGLVLPAQSLPFWDHQLLQTFELEVENPANRDVFTYRVQIRHHKRRGPVLEFESLNMGTSPVFTFADGKVSLAAGPGNPAVEFAFQGATTILSSGLGSGPLLGEFRRLIGVFLFRPDPWNVESVSEAEASELAVDGRNFVSWLRSLAQLNPSAYSQWLDRTREAMPHHNLRLVDAGNRKILVGMTTTKHEISFDDFSEGETLMTMLYAIASARGNWPLIALDEPDNYLSLREVQPVLQQLIEPTEDQSPQLFIATHHPEAIDYLAADATWLFERNIEGHVSVRRMKFENEVGERASTTVREAFE